jgi:hypothetical protein
MEILTDFPKIYCPFLRKTFKISHDDWKKYGSEYKLRTPEVYLVLNKITPGYEWIFEDKDTVASEKLDGTNIKLNTEKGRLVALQNRKNVIDPLQIIKGKNFIIEGVFRGIGKDYVKMDGEQAGEVIGPKLQANPYKLDFHVWYPFERAREYLTYKSFHEHERTFENWSSWFKDYLRSRFYMKEHKCTFEESVFAEGVVFYNKRRQQEEKTYQAKLRRDMFAWFYDKITIPDYDPNGTYDLDDQDQFE